MKLPVIMSWSGGKDCAVALHELQRDARYNVVGLLTTFDEAKRCVPAHQLPLDLIEAQARALELPLYSVAMPSHATNQQYETALLTSLETLKIQGPYTEVPLHLAFGDLFLADVRAYRERLFARADIPLLFPLWGRSTAQLALAVIAQGFQAVVTSVNLRHLTASFTARLFNRDFLVELPATVDACGERGEFHTFVFAAPNFRHPIEYAVEGFVTSDDYHAVCLGLKSPVRSS